MLAPNPTQASFMPLRMGAPILCGQQQQQQQQQQQHV
jgi:hypothetical protein